MTRSWAAEFRGTERYTVQGCLGAGGMGVVYKAWDRERNHVVALKVLQGAGGGDVYRFKKEFRLLTDIIHPHLVTLHELFSDGNHWYFSMEYVEGVDFVSYVRGQGISAEAGQRLRPTTSFLHRSTASLTATSLTAPEEGNAVRSEPTSRPPPLTSLQTRRLRGVLRQLAEGLVALHQAGIIHRDIKPSNVLVTREGRVVILDFGLATENARPDASLSSEQQMAGTPLYMSPEQGAAVPLSSASDWYSVGVMLYETLTGRLPFVGRPWEVLVKKQQHDPQPPLEIQDDLPEDLSALCLRLLRRQPQDRPTEGELLKYLSQDGEAAPVPLASGPSSSSLLSTFVGRGDTLGALNLSLERVKQGRTAVTLMHGGSGVGKSALTQYFFDDVRLQAKVVVLAGRCYERETMPYKALDSLVDALSRYLHQLPTAEVNALVPRDVLALARVFPVLRRVELIAELPARELAIPDQHELRQRAFTALRELLARLGDRRILILHIDDLQWGDLDSAALLGDLLRPPDPPVLLLLGCYRSEDRAGSPFLQALLEPRLTANPLIDFQELAIEPLSLDESHTLALRLLASAGAPASPLAATIAREAGGNPYLIDSLVRARLEASSSEPPTEVTLDEVLWQRVRTLDEAPRRLLEVAAVAGHPLLQHVVCEAAEVGVGRLEAIAVLRASRLIKTVGTELRDQIETYHDRIRESVVNHLLPEQRRHHHLRLATTMEASGGEVDAAALASHYLAAGLPVKSAGHFAVAAAQAAQALAFDRAAGLYRAALEHGQWPNAEERELRTAFADSLANAGRGPEAAREYLAAAEGAKSAEALEMRRRAAMQSLISGHIDDGLEALRTVLTEVGMRFPSSPRRALFSLLWRRFQIRLSGLRFRLRDSSQVAKEDLIRLDICWSAGIGLSVVDPVRGADFLARSLLLALRVGDAYRIARSLSLEAGHIAVAGGRTRRQVKRLLERADELARQTDNPHAIGLVALCNGIASFLQGRWKEALPFCDEGDRIFREQCAGVTWELNTAQTFSEWALFWLGEIDEMRRRLPLLLGEAEKRGNLYALANLGSFAKPMVSMAADDPDAADRELRELMSRWSQKSFHVQHVTGLFGRVQVDIYRGNGAAASKYIIDQWPVLSASLLLRVQQVRIFTLHLRARAALALAVLRADPEPLVRAAENDAQRLTREKIAWADALAGGIRAGIAAFRRDDSLTTIFLEKTINAFERADMALYAASARRRLGKLLGGDEGGRLVAEADAWMTSQGISNPVRMTALHMPGFPN